MDEFFKPLGPLFGNVPAFAGEAGREMAWMPVADVTETEKEYAVKLDLPGVKPEEVQVFTSDGMLHVKGARTVEKKDEGEKQHRCEVFYGTFERAFDLPQNVEAAAITAECRDGVLRVRLPKKSVGSAAPTRIQVQ
jgi:HSP20 family protein